MDKLSTVIDQAGISPSKRKLKLVTRSVEIRTKPEEAETAYFAKILLMCTLPHSDQKEKSVYVRRNGTNTLVVQSGWDVESNKLLGVPYGAIPRLLLAWITTEARVTKNRRLSLGTNLAEFLRSLGYDPDSRGPRSDAKRVRRSINQLLGAKITFSKILSDDAHLDDQGVRNSNMLVSTENELWWSKRDTTESTLWGSWIELSPEFYHAILENTPPCDMRALRMLKQSPLALDLYMLFNFIGTNYPRGFSFSWKQINDQLGLSYADTRNVRKKVQAAMIKVKAAHPGLKFEYPKKTGGIKILPSMPAIPRKAS